MKISKTKLQALKRAVKGNLAQVAEVSETSLSTVSNVLAGKTNNEKVIKAALQVREMLIEERKALETQI